MTETDPIAVARRFWSALYDRDWDGVAAAFTDDALYEDVPAPDLGAVGPAAIVRRLRIGLDPVDGWEHHLERLAADGPWVFTQHRETWTWKSGESVTLPFVSVMLVEGDLIARWSDYWDYQTLLGGAPAWWVEHIMAEYEKDPFAGPTD